MKAGLFFTDNGPILILTSYQFFAYPKFVEKLDEIGISKFIAYEVPIEKVQEKYGRKINIMRKRLSEQGGFWILDDDGQHVFKNFSVMDLANPVLYEKDPHHFNCRQGKLSDFNF